jgi:hypothetical protein
MIRIENSKLSLSEVLKLIGWFKDARLDLQLVPQLTLRSHLTRTEVQVGVVIRRKLNNLIRFKKNFVARNIAVHWQGHQLDFNRRFLVHGSSVA